MKKEEGLRFNSGKARHDLVPAFAQDQYAKVLTKGAEKYAERNWEKGMKWSKVLASLKRHIAAIERGEDFDSETGLLHAAHVMCNAAFLTEYYKIYPQGDDRPHAYLNAPKIGLDIDEVLCDWVGAWRERFGYELPENWLFSYENKKHFDELKASGEMEEFYLNIPAKISPKELPFEPHCYITARSIPTEITQKWLVKHGFAAAPVHTVGFGGSKVDVAKEAGIDIFVDDNYEHFVALNNAGVCTFLMDAAHNRRYNVGYKRIYSLGDLVEGPKAQSAVHNAPQSIDPPADYGKTIAGESKTETVRLPGGGVATLYTFTPNTTVGPFPMPNDDDACSGPWPTLDDYHGWGEVVHNLPAKELEDQSQPFQD
jgi:hypothetical protein